MEAETFNLQLNTENQLIYKETPSERVLELVVHAPRAAAQEKRAALNLALVLDRSGSMSGEKLDYVRQAAAHVLDLLAEGDRASVVAYDDQVTLVAESTPITRQTRDDLKRRVLAIRTGGSTNLSGGWFRGCEQVALHMQDDGGQINRALLLTDGLANVGITDLEALAVHARELAGRGISTSTFGVGAGYNEYLLEAISQQGRGAFYFISYPSDIPQIFTQEFEELSAITARDVEIEIDLPAGVTATVLGGLRCEMTARKVRVSIGSLAGGREQSVYFTLVLPPSSSKKELFVKAVARAKGLDGAMLEAAGALAFHYAAAPEVDSARPREDVLQRTAQVRVSELTNEALKLEREGRTDQAAQMLERGLHAAAPHLSSDQVAYHEKLARRMREGMEETDRKTAHYASYLSRNQRVDRTFAERQKGPAGPASSSDLLNDLLSSAQIRLNESPLLRSTPAPLPAGLDFDRVEGMLLGLAVGDSLGNTSESMTPGARRARFGEIRDYLPNRHVGGRPAGLPSDDTQMAFWTLEVLLDRGRLDPEALARRFSSEQIFGIGSSVKAFLSSFKDQRVPWQLAGTQSAGNGALMRIAPVLLPHLKRPSPDLWADAALSGMLTHNDYASNAACIAFTAMLWDLLGMDRVPAPEWWAETYAHYAAPLEGAAAYTSRMPGLSYTGPVWRFAQAEVARAMREGWTVEQAANTWGSGAYLLETVPTTLFVLARYGADPEQALLRAANDTWDNDTVAAIVGAALGALHGKSALPSRWLTGLLGRTNDRNDGHIFRLIESARRAFF